MTLANLLLMVSPLGITARVVMRLSLMMTA